MALLDLLAIVLGLNLFALFHHVIPTYFPEKRDPVPVSGMAAEEAEATPAVPQPSPEATEEPAEEPAATEAPKRSGMWGERFASRFTDGEVIENENSYRSANISVTVETVRRPSVVYYVAEVFVSDLKYLRTAIGYEVWGRSESAQELAQRHRAVIAISGDHYYGRLEGIMIRNGLLYRDSRFEDICVLLQDGRMLTLPDGELSLEELTEMEPWQVWSFGPRLLENGKAREEIDSSVVRANPRSAIGYVEPGHYFFVVVDGRGGNDSGGMTLQELAEVFEDLGCETAYNLDGGRTASMIWKGELLSFPYYRPVYDIIYVTD